jgi:hypothetical protein
MKAVETSRCLRLVLAVTESLVLVHMGAVKLNRIQRPAESLGESSDSLSPLIPQKKSDQLRYHDD